MKLLRYGDQDLEKPGILDMNGDIRDLCGVIDEIDGATLGPESLAKLAAIDVNGLPRVTETVRIGAVVASPSKFVATV